jgi:hypothetical protein
MICVIFPEKIGSQPGSLTPDASTSSSAAHQEDGFVVQKGRSVPTLTSVVDKSDKEQFNKDTKSEELGESESQQHENNVFQQMKNIPVAGRPSDAPRRTSFYSKGGQNQQNSDSNPSGAAKERTFSRRNSVDDNASSLSVENLGGSQDNLTLLGRNPDKEMRTHTGRRPSEVEVAPNNDRYLDNREVEEMERRQRESMSPMKAGQQYVRLSSEGPAQDKVSFADLRKQKARDHFHTSGINITYTEQEKEDLPKKASTLLSRRDSQQRALSESPMTTSQQDPHQTSPGPGQQQLFFIACSVRF